MEYDDKPLDYEMQEGLHINEASRRDLGEAARWAKFLAILGFIGVGIMVLTGLVASAMLGSLPGMDSEPFPPAILAFFYIAFALLYFLPILYLYRFAAHAQEAVRGSSTQELEVALANIKSHYKFIGILAVVLLGFYALGIAFVVLAGLTESLVG